MNIPTRTDCILFLDFDGVICDSLRECLVVSWIAYHHHFRKSRPDRVAVGLRAKFADMRCLIRSGEDYLLIQHLIAHSEEVTAQRDFDRQAERIGSDTMHRFQELFYAARSELLESDRQYWLRLNRIYTHMLDGMRDLSDSAPVFIISTKRIAYIDELLRAHGIGFDVARIIYSGASRKLSIISSVLDASACPQALFVDDQIDHFADNKDQRIDCRLATWGFVKPQWLQQAETIAPDKMRRLLRMLTVSAPGATPDQC